MDISLIVLKQNLRALNQDTSRWHAAHRGYDKKIPTAPGTVFAIPELLETILLHLGPLDLLNIQRVNKSCKAIIDNSPPLQRKLHLRATPYSYLGTLHASHADNSRQAFPGLSISVTDHHDTRALFRAFCGIAASPRSRDNRVNISIRCPVVPGSIPRVGLRCRRMLICQPPLKELKVQTNCCLPSRWAPSRGYRPKAHTYTSTDGFTVGELLDITEKLSRLHANCPDATEDMIDADGFVKVQARFETTLELYPDDPILGSMVVKGSQAASTAARSRHLKAYNVEKCSARARGSRVPTLREFIVTNGLSGPLSLS